MRSVCSLAVWGVLFATAGAGAEPYELLAVYAPVNGTARDIELSLARDTLFPDGAEGYRLQRIIARFKADALAATTLSAFRKFEFRVSVNEQPREPVTVEARELEPQPDRDVPLLDWTGDGQHEARSFLKVEVRSIYTPEFLCLQEWELLDREGEEAPKEALEALRSAHLASDGGVDASADGGEESSPDGGTGASRKKFLRADGRRPLILYSFCKGFSGETPNDSQPWDALAPEAGAASDRLSVFRFEDRSAEAKEKGPRWQHKKALVDRLAARLNQFPSHFGQATVDTSAEEYERALLYVRDDYRFSILKAGGAVTLQEESGGQVRFLADQLDQESQVLLAVEHNLCINLPTEGLLKPPWFFVLEVVDKDAAGATKRLDVQLGFRHGCTRVLAVQWKDFLDQQVTFRIVFRHPGAEELVIYRHTFHIYNFGLITILPVASEVLSAVTKASAKDIESSSVIPVSLALSVGGERSNSFAVTFPFILGVNTRSAPQLAEYIALAPSVSLIAGDSDKAPHVAVGIGLNLARAFHFGYAWAPDASSDYVLIGVSIPELMPLLSGIVGGGSGVVP
ncbi:hypothetical protein [Myxococcus sp. RHSTA-1-4]|uniref:hypothetical protein n=1 Tax=Myxococcus sp. RHSTA-1-4 TaxID=2874601 RepID=UPI001CC139F3|nr:hypothetical protein [Myxococcus sp. RHSTA-1-4]MBZ4422801.1 hypothetical protein [Myxococcus sp. RHSTA-1-4]